MSTITVECKKLCLTRCLSAVALSILMQFILLTVFLLFVNFHILHPIKWITGTVGLMFSFYTWFSIIPLMTAVVIYGVLLGKSHLAIKKYYPSRFNWLVGTILRKLIFLKVHVLVGFLTAWLYTRFLHVDYRNLFSTCDRNDCLNSRYTFLICAGIAAGCYHFVKENLRHEPEIEFPIIQEVKLVQIRSQIYTTLYKSLMKSFMPTLGFAFAYFLFSGLVNKRLASIFSVEIDDTLATLFAISTDLRLLFYTWILSAQILSNMHLMQCFFSILLAEEMHFAIEKNPVLGEMHTAQVTLVDALSMQQVPVIQNLAALDLYNISLSKVPVKRQEIFTLSLPGGHPYNWNQLSGQCLSLIQAFTAELATSVKNISNMKSVPLFASIKPSATDAAEKILLRQYNETFGIRRMMAEPCPSSPATTSEPKSSNNACQRINAQFEQFARQIETACRTAFRTIPGLYYAFGEPDGAKTAFLLSNSQAIVWLTQGLASICAHSLVEDKYGVVQVALPEIIQALLKLKLELDKLNNVNLNGKKLDRNLVTLKNAVRRSLYKICTVFGDYLRDLIDDPEDLRNLQCFLRSEEEYL